MFHNSNFQFSHFHFVFPPPLPTSFFLSFVPIVCAIIQIYAKYNTLLATFWHPLDSALSIRLVELICFDCPVDPAPLPSSLRTLLPACLHCYLSNQLSTQSAIAQHLAISLSLPLFLILPLPLAMRAFCGSRLAEAKSSSGCHCDRLLSSGKGKVFSASN